VSIKTPRLIQDRCGVYYFRLIVPLSWRHIVKKTEIRRSLRTKDAAIARQAALLLSARMEVFVANSKSKSKLKTFADLSPEELEPLLKLKAEIDQQAADMNMPHKAKAHFFGKNGAGDFHIETDTLEELQEVRALMADYAKSNSASIGQALNALPISKCGIDLVTASKGFLDQRQLTLAAATYRKDVGIMSAFIEYVGNMDVAMVQAKTVREYKEGMVAAKLAATTINDKLTVVRLFFEYCIGSNIAVMKNPADGLLIPGANNQAESYDPFTEGELQKIFEPSIFLKKSKLPDLYWGPLLAVFTGARAEELASLTLDQVYPAKGIWLINILKGKTENAPRQVPIHDQILALGFLEYVKALKAAGYQRLFPHLQDGKNGYKKNMCRQFGEYLDLPEVNIVNPLKVFHSFRHTVVTALTNAGVNEGLKRKLVGHDLGTQQSSHDDYIHASMLTVPNLQIAINKLNYEDVDFSKLNRAQDTFMPIIAKRIVQQAELKKKKEEKAAAEAKAKAEAEKLNGSAKGPKTTAIKV
jgi:integrase